MGYVSEASRPSLASYIVGRLAAGRLVFSREEAQVALGIGRGAFLDAAEKLQKRDRLLNLRQGFYVIVPPQYLNFGSPPPASFIDDLMRHESRPYYVGLLKAAELQGASHQAVMEFQVVTNRQMRDVQVGRSKIAFYFRKDMSAIASGIEERKTDTGKMKISSVELTLLDLLRYPQASAGLDNILTVFSDLGSKLNPEGMGVLSRAFEPIRRSTGRVSPGHVGVRKTCGKTARVDTRSLAVSPGSSLTRRYRPIQILPPRFKLVTSAGMY